MNRKVLKIKQNIIVLCLVSLSVWALSCNRTDIEEEYIGKSGFLVTLADDISVETRSTPLQLENPLTTDFNLKIVRTSTDTPVYDGKYKEELIQAPAGFYDVTAWFGENPVLAVDAPYYWGTVTGVEVKKDTPAEVSVSCKVANALLSVVYDESIAKIYDSYYVTVSVGGESREIRDNQSAYFRAGSVATVAFHGVLKGESEEHVFELQHEGLLAPLGAAEHAVLNLSIEAGVMVSVEKLDIETVTVSETIPLEYLPKPKLESTDFVENELSFAETETKSAVINLKLSSPLQDLKLKFTSADAKFASLNREEGYLLSNAEDKDIVEKALGITLPEIGTTEAVLDFSSLIPQLMTDAGNTVSSTIEVDAKANNRWSSDKETDLSARRFTLTCNKPEFKVSAYPGNIWTKEFTMNPLLAEDVISGDYEILSKNMRYQFSIDGKTNWTDFGEDLRKADLNPGSTYYIRGVYRDVINSNPVSVTTYPIIDLENGDMELWSYTDGPEGDFWGRGPFWKRWYLNAFKDDGQEGWCSLNGLTTSDWDVKAYVSNSGTEQTTNCHSKQYAAEIKTIGWGNGTTAASPISIIKKITPGELFLGRLDNNTPIYGISFKSKPTKLNFFYKYIPEGEHKFKVKLSLSNGDKLIAEKEFDGDRSDTYSSMTLDFGYHYEDNSDMLKYEVLTLSIQFISGDNSKSEVDKASIDRGSRHVGNKLYVDDISLIYDK